MFILLSFLSLFSVASPSYGNLLSVWFRIVQRPSLHFDLILFNQQYHFPWFDDLWTGRHSSLFIGPVWCHFSNILAISECTIRNISFVRVKKSKTERERKSRVQILQQRYWIEHWEISATGKIRVRSRCFSIDSNIDYRQNRCLFQSPK